MSENTRYRLEILGGMALSAVVIAVVAWAFLYQFSPTFRAEIDILLRALETVLE
jgi:hypothetical protein